MALKFETWLEAHSDENVLVTSFHWGLSSLVSTRDPPKLTFVVTYSDGGARIYSVETRDRKPTTSSQYLQLSPHSEEAWSAAFSPRGHLVFTGGDDIVFTAYDYHPTDSEQSLTEVGRLWSDSRTHGAGVTAILPIETSPDCCDRHTVLTGSYDEFIRVFTIDNSLKRRVEAEERLGGGVWRLKQIAEIWCDRPSSTFPGTRCNALVLASCMHAGVRILHVMRLCPRDCSHQSCTWTIDIVGKFEEHKSMNYASDVRIVNGRPLIVSTSFYDRLLCVWPLDHWSMGQNGRRAMRHLTDLQKLDSRP